MGISCRKGWRGLRFHENYKNSRNTSNDGNFSPLDFFLHMIVGGIKENSWEKEKKRNQNFDGGGGDVTIKILQYVSCVHDAIKTDVLWVLTATEDIYKVSLSI